MIEFATFLVLKPLFGIPLLDNLASAMGTVMGGHGHGGGASYGGGVSSGYGAPSGGYGAPSDGYGAPSDGYGAPSDGYGAPSGDSGYNPGTDYAAPADSYHGRRRRGAPGDASGIWGEEALFIEVWAAAQQGRRKAPA